MYSSTSNMQAHASNGMLGATTLHCNSLLKSYLSVLNC